MWRTRRATGRRLTVPVAHFQCEVLGVEDHLLDEFRGVLVDEEVTMASASPAGSFCRRPVHGDGDLAANGTAFQLPHRICRVFERVGAVQGWVDLPGFDEVGEPLVVVGAFAGEERHEPLSEPPRSFRRLGLVAQPVGVSLFLAA
jgi:hypothetical protein